MKMGLNWLAPVVGAASIVGCVAFAATPGTAGPDPEQWDSAVKKGIAYLRTTQAGDGSWSSQAQPRRHRRRSYRALAHRQG